MKGLIISLVISAGGVCSDIGSVGFRVREGWVGSSISYFSPLADELVVGGQILKVEDQKTASSSSVDISTYIQQGIGAGFVGVGSFFGGLILAMIPMLPYEESARVSPDAPFVFCGVGFLVATLGPAVGATIVGELLNQEGSLLNSWKVSIIGGLIPLSTGIGIAAIMGPRGRYSEATINTFWVTTILSTYIGSVVGAVIGYHR
jgi:hypothetical protein